MKNKEKDDLFDNLPGRAAEFIKLIIRKMRYRKKVRADVQAELTAHFEDELHDCRSDEEKEQKARELIEQFGDARLLAVLLRRAKKRCRPLWQKVIVRAFMVLGLTIFYLFLCWVRLLIGTPTISFDLVEHLNNTVMATENTSLNAKPYYDKAAELYVECPKLICNKYGLPRKDIADFNDPQIKRFRQWLKDNQSAFETFRQGTVKPFYWNTYSSNDSRLSGNSELQDSIKYQPAYIPAVVVFNAAKKYVGYRRLARAMRCKILYDIYKSDKAEAFNNCIALYKCANHLQGKGLLIEQINGMAFEDLAHQLIYQLLEKTDLSSDSLRLIQHQLQEKTNEAELINIDAERAYWHATLQSIFTDDGKGNGRLLKRGIPFVVENWQDGLLGFLFWSYPDRKEFTTKIEHNFDKLEQLLQRTPAQWRKKAECDIFEQVERVSLIFKIQARALKNTVLVAWRAETQRAALITILAVLRYKEDTEIYPENLDELLQLDYLDMIPIDAYSDKPFVYKKTEDGFILYSVGSNFTDDGGEVFRDENGKVKRYADQGDWVFWPTDKN